MSLERIKEQMVRPSSDTISRMTLTSCGTVRQKAKDITNLLLDESRMSSQRKSRKQMRDRMAGEGRPRSNTGGDGSDERRRPERRANSVPPSCVSSSLPRRDTSD